MNEEKLSCKCGRKMGLVAAGLYCIKKHYIMEPVRIKPVERSFDWVRRA